jgi:hypothetical protein
MQLIDTLATKCEECDVAMPWQIKIGNIVIPPSTGNTNALPNQQAPGSWRVVCAGCGEEIEWGEVGAGTPRWKDDGRPYALTSRQHRDKRPPRTRRPAL